MQDVFVWCALGCTTSFKEMRPAMRAVLITFVLSGSGILAWWVDGVATSHRMKELRIELPLQERLVEKAQQAYLDRYGRYASSFDEAQIRYVVGPDGITHALLAGNEEWSGWVAYEYVFCGEPLRPGNHLVDAIDDACTGVDEYRVVAAGDFSAGLVPRRLVDVWIINGNGLKHVELRATPSRWIAFAFGLTVASTAILLVQELIALLRANKPRDAGSRSQARQP